MVFMHRTVRNAKANICLRFIIGLSMANRNNKPFLLSWKKSKRHLQMLLFLSVEGANFIKTALLTCNLRNGRSLEKLKVHKFDPSNHICNWIYFPISTFVVIYSKENSRKITQIGQYKRYVYDQWVKNTKPPNLSVFKQD